MSEEIKDEIKSEKPAPKAKAKVEKPADAAPVRTDGLVAFTKDGVTIRRNVEQSSALEKAGWSRV